VLSDEIEVETRNRKKKQKGKKSRESRQQPGVGRKAEQRDGRRQGKGNGKEAKSNLWDGVNQLVRLV
jgi:hypothetical protein